MNPLRHILELIGLTAIAIGCYQIYPPTAWIFGGAAALLLAFCCKLLERNKLAQRRGDAEEID